MQNFTYFSPTKVIFGQDAVMNTVEEIKQWNGSRIFVVYGGGSVVKSGLLSTITDSLEKANLPYEVLGGVKPNPLLSLAKEGVKRALAFNADFILAVGGGSVIDTAKGIAHGVANPEKDIWDFWLMKEPVTKSLPVGCVLTISAAGSETSNSSVLTNDETGSKRGLSTDFNRPKFSIMDPVLTYTLPKYHLTCGIVDIMMHTMDRYFTHSTGNELTDVFAEALLRTVIKNGSIAYANQEDYQAMSELMWCGSISHNGLTGLGAVTDFAPHQLGHELSGKFDVAHGASLSTIWKHWALYAYQENTARFARFAKEVWGIEKENNVDAALAGIQATADYFRSIDMPTNFTELGIGIQSEEVLADLADRASFYGTRLVGNFKKLTKEDNYQIYKSANI